MIKKRKAESYLTITKDFNDGTETFSTLLDYYGCNQLSETSSRRNRCHPKGATKIKAKTTKPSFIAERNEITSIYAVEKKVTQFK